MSDELAHLVVQAAAFLLAFLALKLIVYALEVGSATATRLRARQPLAGVGDTHQCRMHKVARENRNGKEFTLYRCDSCDKRRWYEEGS